VPSGSYLHIPATGVDVERTLQTAAVKIAVGREADRLRSASANA